jgi:putative ABC transport system substrate-binding protein
MDLRWHGDDNNRSRALAQELVGLQPEIIVAGGTPATATLQRETRTVPIVFTIVADLVASGIVTRLDRPGGNITGFASFEASLGGKWLELLKEAAPNVTRAAFLLDLTPIGPRLRLLRVPYEYNSLQFPSAMSPT